MNLKLSKQLKQADLNLLITLHLLLKYKSVKRVAEELHLSQSAVSRALGRLRETFSDELFTRSYSGLVPTEKALSLSAPLSNVVNEIEELIVENEFDVSSCSTTFVVSAPALLGFRLIPELLIDILEQAPLSSVVETQPSANPIPLINDGKVDFAIHNVPTFDKNYYCQQLGSTNVVLYVNEAHPLLEVNGVTYEELSKYPVIGNMVDTESDSGFQSPITLLCDRLGASISPSFRSVQLHSLITMTEKSNSILVASDALKFLYPSTHSLRRLEIEDEMWLSMDVYLVALKSKVMKPEYEWFRDALLKKWADIMKS